MSSSESSGDDVLRCKPSILDVSNSESDDEESSLLGKGRKISKDSSIWWKDLSPKKSAEAPKKRGPDTSAHHSPTKAPRPSDASANDIDWDLTPPSLSKKPLRQSPRRSETDDKAAAIIRQNQETLQRLQDSRKEEEEVEDDDDDIIQIIEPQAKAQMSGTPLSLTLRTKCKWELVVATHSKTPLTDVFKKFEETEKAKAMQKVNKRPAKFMFDGEMIKNPMDTPEKFDMEDDDIIDVC
mmetsp:Transcript_1396/g.1984  ORF Transcript_1396/g.1984 Transcript_1396/m.1984 type:complete len:239 (+) Transcript_1396:204-920(+)|eukprot:CAMPEP_0196572270 /NCGR_PEP_ID=MMETSP1081-20130531/2351_1 /TAXON_ID=36882 /ORGANISM="Pyramimonas amylifera, Strain CCMP720" /LENGTH=238 /DNA_ID=CAMNT_0041889531 /DNA_START=189 /DNA_END=905 /DNA_ORIENTATION=-